MYLYRYIQIYRYTDIHTDISGGKQLIATMIYSTVFSLHILCKSVETDKADALKSWVCKVLILPATLWLVYILLLVFYWCPLEELPDFKLQITKHIVVTEQKSIT